jgi:hypothetical protein
MVGSIINDLSISQFNLSHICMWGERNSVESLGHHSIVFIILHTVYSVTC